MGNQLLKIKSKMRKGKSKMSDIEKAINNYVEEIWAEFDKDKSGELDKDEARDFLDSVIFNQKGSEGGGWFDNELFEETFKELDTDRNGTIEKDEVASFVKKLAGISE